MFDSPDQYLKIVVVVIIAASVMVERGLKFCHINGSTEVLSFDLVMDCCRQTSNQNHSL